MTATSWVDIVGQLCDQCGRLASHYYGSVKLCCPCHVGGDFEPIFAHREIEYAHLKTALEGLLELDGISEESPQYQAAETVLRIVIQSQFVVHRRRE